MLKGHGAPHRRDPLHAKRADPNIQAEFTTLNKDGKAVWEPGLPAEVTSRRVHKPVKARPEAPEEVQVVCDLKIALKMKAGERAEWLDKALRGIPHGRAKVQDVFNIVTHPKFVIGVPDRIGRRMLQMVAGALDAFSEKQRATLVSKCKLAELFQATVAGGHEPEDDDEPDEDPQEDAGDGSPVEKAASPEAVRPRSRSRSRPRRSSAEHRSSDRRSSDHRSSDHRSSGSRRSPSPEVRRRTGESRSSASRPSPPRASQPAGSAPRPTPEASTKRDEAHSSPPRSSRSGSNALQPELSPQERARMERAFLEKQHKQDEERKRAEAERKAHEDREKQRKAKLGNAFVLSQDDDEDDGRPQLPPGSLVVKKGQPERPLPQELGYPDLQPLALARPLALPGGGQDPRFVEAMGGDKLLAEAHKILQSAAGTGRLGAASPPPRRRSRSRGRGRSRSPKKRLDMRSTGSYRSPTPDGRARGQARAARKAKMIASLMGLNSR